jgi:hypothetical protein
MSNENFNVEQNKLNEVTVKYDNFGSLNYVSIIEWRNGEGVYISIEDEKGNEKLFSLHTTELDAINLAYQTLNLNR